MSDPDKKKVKILIVERPDLPAQVTTITDGVSKLEILTETTDFPPEKKVMHALMCCYVGGEDDYEITDIEFDIEDKDVYLQLKTVDKWISHLCVNSSQKEPHIGFTGSPIIKTIT